MINKLKQILINAIIFAVVFLFVGWIFASWRQDYRACRALGYSWIHCTSGDRK